MKQRTTIYLDPLVRKKAKIYCIENGTSVSMLLETYLTNLVQDMTEVLATGSPKEVYSELTAGLL